MELQGPGTCLTRWQFPSGLPSRRFNRVPCLPMSSTCNSCVSYFIKAVAFSFFSTYTTVTLDNPQGQLRSFQVVCFCDRRVRSRCSLLTTFLLCWLQLTSLFSSCLLFHPLLFLFPHPFLLLPFFHLLPLPSSSSFLLLLLILLPLHLPLLLSACPLRLTYTPYTFVLCFWQRPFLREFVFTHF